MPLDLANVDAVNAVWFVPAAGPWRDGLRTLLAEMGGDAAAIDAWLDVLERRAAGAAQLARYGEAFAAWMARGCELLSPDFALSDGMQQLGDFLARPRPGRVRHPAPAGAGLADTWPTGRPSGSTTTWHVG